jgi:hypothetical protein
MTQTLVDRLRTVSVSAPTGSAGLQAFGLRWEQPPGPDYATLDEGLQSGQLEVAEVSEGGSVPSLKVTNKGDTPVFLMAGEQLSGGKQNRVLNASILVPAHAELPIPVSCVERGRWSYRSATFGSSGTAMHARLRRVMHDSTTHNLKAHQSHSSDQGAVWGEVDRKLAETQTRSGTAVLQDAYDNVRESLEEVAAGLAPPEGAAGVVFAYGGKIVGLDLFDRPATLARLWPKLVRAYAMDARYAPADAPAVTADEVRGWLGSVAGAKEEEFKSPGVGQDVRVEAPTLSAAGLLVDGSAVHVEAFANHPVPA